MQKNYSLSGPPKQLRSQEAHRAALCCFLLRCVKCLSYAPSSAVIAPLVELTYL